MHNPSNVDLSIFFTVFFNPSEDVDEQFLEFWFGVMILRGLNKDYNVKLYRDESLSCSVFCMKMETNEKDWFCLCNLFTPLSATVDSEISNQNLLF